MHTLYQILRTGIKLLLGRGVRHSYSQDAEDLLIRSLLNSRNGTYVDVGAYHPILYSNTYGLYKRGWRGVAIDPNSSFRPLYAVFRPRDTFVCAGIGRTAKTAPYYRFSDGAYNTFSEIEAQSRPAHLEKRSTEEVPLRPLRDILKEKTITAIDFLSIDVEGFELEVLESHDWSVLPRFIAVEDNAFNADAPQGSAVYKFLSAKGYRLAAVAPRTPIFALQSPSAPKTS